MCIWCIAPYPTRPLEQSHCRANPPWTVPVHCEHILMWSVCTGRTRRSGRSVYTGNPTRTVRERYARRVKLPVWTRPYFLPGFSSRTSSTVIELYTHSYIIRIKQVFISNVFHGFTVHICKINTTAHHTPGRSSSIFSRTPVSWSRNQCHPILSILETFRGLLSDTYFFISVGYRRCLATLVMVFLWVFFPSSLTPLQQSALTFPFSSFCSFTVLPICLENCTSFRVWSPILVFMVLCERTIIMASVFNRFNCRWYMLKATCHTFMISTTVMISALTQLSSKQSISYTGPRYHDMSLK